MKASSWSALYGDSVWICAGCRSRLARPTPEGFVPKDRRLASSLGSHNRRAQQELSIQRRWLSQSSSLKAAPTRKSKLPDGPARTRFAPSPTGYLHIGGLRTALFSYLLAKRTGGQFILRIEDTDQKRLIGDAEARLCKDLAWAGLRWDEGPDVDGPYGPYKQSLRNEIYKKHAQDLLKVGQAYRCFCTPQTAGEAKAAYVTSGCYQNCSSLSSEQSEERAADAAQHFTIRLRQPHDAHKRSYSDLIYGNIQRLKRSPSAPLTASEDDTALDASDTILVKSDGTPTYHFANVVDDHLMGITHVIRGSEWMASTPLHYDIYTAFDWKPPSFAHVGLLVDQNKAKLSKRNADLALDVASMRDKHGVLPAPLINFLALLGWSNPTNNDVMELDDLVRNFDLKFTRGNAMVRMEKLWFLQKAHVAQLCEKASRMASVDSIRPLVDQIVPQVRKAFPELLLNRNLLDEPSVSDYRALANYVALILLEDSKSFQNAAHFVERNQYFFAFDPAGVPMEQEYYNKAETLTPAHLHGLLERAFERADHALVDHKRKAPEMNKARTATRALAISAKFDAEDRVLHQSLSHEIYLAALDFSAQPTLCAPPEPLPTPSSMSAFSRPAALARLPLLLKRSEEEGTSSEQVWRQLLEPHTSDEELEVLVKRFKVVNGAVMKFLREKLSLGLPGPHVRAIMGILGKEECARRLGIVGSRGE